MEKEQMERLKTDVTDKFQKSQATFSKAAKKDRDYLQLFSFICMLSFDVYVKKLLIEKLVDEACAFSGEKNGGRKDKCGEKESEE